MTTDAQQPIDSESVADAAVPKDIEDVLEQPDEAISIASRALGRDPDKKSELLYQYLRRLVDDSRSGAIWNTIDKDRDSEVERLWRHLADGHGSYIEQYHGSLAYHRQRLFAWFLDRYELARARRILKDKAPWPNWGLPYLPVVTAVIGILAASHGWHLRLCVPLAASGYLLAIGWWWASVGRSSTMEFVKSLIPRLAGTAAAGAGLLLTSGELLVFIATRMTWPSSLLLLGLATTYLMLEIEHRVQPRPSLKALALKTFNLVLLALAHSSVIVLLILPVLRHLVPGAALGWQSLLAFTTVVFAAGLVLNVIWAEEPVTRPL